ncbi:ESS family glutamate:Na+ symporter [Geomicrobium halophilum]|uniref:ESS family glutamate:Na+ symporter n=1 Tax=Geomicrobium halophilum TaxID=549000 RepID=A0A841Q0L5_9BACL|nr:sodium/glutamate symporter [Geomicrobium halophilum]MBB6451122.1 ESS family glutamate:Na+ symporter [Geomicrobium halophilum]
MSLEDLTIDIGLMSLLLLIGILIRAKVRMIQKLFIPASFIAGLLGLTFGPNGFGLLPFSNFIGDYPTILIAVVFAAIPLGAAKINWKEKFGRVRNMWLYSMTITLLMWPAGIVATYLFIGHIWDLPPGFGFALGAGFVGGHGTAAAVGEIFSAQGWQEITDIGYTAATVGLLAAVLGGLIIIKRNTRRKQTNFISDFQDLPSDLRTGLIRKEDRESAGHDTVSSNNVDPLFFHVAIIGAVVVVSYFLQQMLNANFPELSFPLLSLAFIIGLIAQFFLRKSKANYYVDKRTINRVGGTATDLIVVFGITSIDLAIVSEYMIPLIVLFIFGVIWAYLILHFVAVRVFHQDWFENGIFGFGWSTGTVAMGVALLRIVDPDSKSTTLDDYALGYIGMVPVEVAIITFGPVLIISGFSFPFMLSLLLIWVLLIVFASKMGWLVSKDKIEERN